MPKHQPIPHLLGQLNTPGYDRNAIVRGVAIALDLSTPLGLVPGVGPILEMVTDAIWMSAAEAIVAEAEKAIAKKRKRDAAKAEAIETEKTRGFANSSLGSTPVTRI